MRREIENRANRFFSLLRRRVKHDAARVNRKVGRNLLLAILSGVLLAGIVLLSLFVWPPLFAVLAAVTAAVAAGELVNAVGKRYTTLPLVLVGAGAFVTVGLSWFWREGGFWLGFTLSLLAFIGVEIAQTVRAQIRLRFFPAATRCLTSLLCYLYVTAPLSLAVILRQTDIGRHTLSYEGYAGAFVIIGFLAVVVSSDTAAYIFGLSCGKHKLAPRISPAKTWEGFAGGFVASFVVGTLAGLMLFRGHLGFAVLFALVIFACATVGDLAESLLKRHLGIKDMSSVIPGHGGLLDRLDSVLPSIIGTYVLVQLFWTVA